MASKAVRVAVVAEGPTDFIALRAAVRALLSHRDFEFTMIEPDVNENLVPRHGGWGGVYWWCRQAVEQASGPLRDNPIFAFHDVLVVQVDADVARKHYKDYGFQNAPTDLKCEQPCPPASATTDALRAVMLGWLSEKNVPRQTVFCTPSKTLEPLPSSSNLCKPTSPPG